MTRTQLGIIGLTVAILGTMAVAPRSQASASAYTDGQAAGSAKGRQAARDDQPKDEQEAASSSGGCCG